MNIDFRDVTILVLVVAVIWLLRGCADDGNRAAVRPVTEAEDAGNVTAFRQEPQRARSA